MEYTLEDFLVRLHTGQWFGFDGDKIYANLIIHSSDPKPIEQECIDGVASLQAEYDSFEYARNRASAYPEIGDQLDALFHAGVFPPEMASLLQAVKDKYPKGQ
jgi:hypothetical protein